MTDRVGCINPRCKRTFKRTREHEEVICGKCFRTLPDALRNDHRRYWREIRKWDRRILRTQDVLESRRMHGIINRWIGLLNDNWERIKAAIENPEKPEGLEPFLKELGL